MKNKIDIYGFYEKERLGEYCVYIVKYCKVRFFLCKSSGNIIGVFITEKSLKDYLRKYGYKQLRYSIDTWLSTD